MPIEQEEFELIPVSPLRRLERRMEQVESTGGVDVREFLKELVDIIKMNQQLVDQLAKANDALRIELSKLPSKIEDLVNNLSELLSYIKASAVEEAVPGTAFKPLADKLDKLIDANKKLVEHNQSMLSALEDIGNKLKRPHLLPFGQLPPRRIPPKPIIK